MVAFAHVILQIEISRFDEISRFKEISRFNEQHTKFCYGLILGQYSLLYIQFNGCSDLNDSTQ